MVNVETGRLGLLNEKIWLVLFETFDGRARKLGQYVEPVNLITVWVNLRILTLTR